MFKAGLLTRESPCESKQVDSEFVTIFEKIFSKNEQLALEMQKSSTKQTYKHVARIGEISGVRFFSASDNFAIIKQ